MRISLSHKLVLAQNEYLIENAVHINFSWQLTFFLSSQINDAVLFDSHPLTATKIAPEEKNRFFGSKALKLC